VALLAVLITGLVSIGLIRGAAESQAAHTLGNEADLVANLLERAPRALALRQPAVNALLRREQITVARVGQDGRVVIAQRFADLDPLPVPARDAATIAAGGTVDATRTLGGQRLLVVGRPMDTGGGVALVQPASEAGSLTSQVRGRLGLALLAGLAGAALVGVLLARLLARPLQAAARAAHHLAGGRRDVRVEPSGPAEVAGVAEALNTLAGALQTSEGRQREFLLSVSHELRTPLTAVAGFAEALADGVTPPAEVPATGAIVLAESRRLERLVSDLLDLARLGADDFRIDLAAVDLTELVRAAGDVWRARCRAEGVALRTELPDGPVIVSTDGTRVRQIIDGLAENALRVVPAGAPIVFGLAVVPPWVLLLVRDGGPGLTPQDCAVAFERSALYDRYRGIRRVGTGVGLALVAGLATRLGGTAAAGRAPEGGAAFMIRLPFR
jgi:two-component system sensor histidine kinase BaeS